MTDLISAKQFEESEGVSGWRVLGDGASAYFRPGSITAGARLVQAIGEWRASTTTRRRRSRLFALRVHLYAAESLCSYRFRRTDSPG